MENYAEILEHEFENAVEVKDKQSLHRVVRLIAENTVGRQEYGNDIGELKSDVKLIVERMEQGFKRMDERFESMQAQMDRRFETVDKRFESMQIQMDRRFDAADKRFDEMNGKFRMMFTFMTLGFTVLSALTVLIKILI